MSTALPRSASVLIIGGGMHGLATAFNLADMGLRDLVVLDAGYWQGGASGRNGGLIRGGFSTPEWTRLFAFSNQQWAGFSRRLGHNVMFARRGYSMIAETERTAALFESALAVHREHGLRSEILSEAAIERLLPALNRRTVRRVLHLPDGGVAPHHATMKALLAACRERGVDIRYRTAVSGFERSNGRIAAVLVGAERIAAELVLVAAGAHNIEVARMAGVSLAGFGMRIEAMALEPVRPLIRPALALIDRLVYLHQTARGEIVGGIDVPERPRMSLKVDVPVMTGTAKVYLEMLPQLANLRILRHWAGMLHITPDFGPLMGEHPDLNGLWFSGGWSYGWAGGPGAGALMAKAIAKGEIDERMKPFALDRFDRGRPVHEAAVVLSKFET